MQVAGYVYGVLGAVDLGDDPAGDAGNRVTIARGGTLITADNPSAEAISITSARFEIVNNGTIQGRVGIDSDGFGAGLGNGQLQAALFWTRADNKAQDGNDRFIFRTGDETLWFDRDGKGGTGPVLIADLQDGAVLTAPDIVVF